VTTNNKALPVLAILATACFLPGGVCAQTIPSGAAIDAEVNRLMTRNGAKGMAVAVIDHGKVGYVHAYGIRNVKGDPLTADTVMYGASLTKTVFAYTVMQLVDQGELSLDAPIKDDLDKPLPSYSADPFFPDKYGPYKDLTDDPRWEKITPRMALTIRPVLATSGSSNRTKSCTFISSQSRTLAIRVKVSSCCSSSLSTAERRRAWGSMSAI
jgi:CubicO group peptidase (beta-lactamase class C family)